MKKVTITFEVTEKTTHVMGYSSSGINDSLDITGTDIEKDFVKLIKKLNKEYQAREVLKFIDPATWKEVDSSNKLVNK